MYNEISAGVGIQVETTFRPDLSDLVEGTYFFNYRITIVNTNDFSIQLLHRDWHIFDSLRLHVNAMIENLSLKNENNSLKL